MSARVPRLSTALPQVKELGVVMYNCSCLARDLTKIFEAYWFLGQPGSSIPSTWPRPFDTRYNQETPMEICLNGTPALAYLAVSWGKWVFTCSWPHVVTPCGLHQGLPGDCSGGRTGLWSKAWAISHAPSALDSSGKQISWHSQPLCEGHMVQIPLDDV